MVSIIDYGMGNIASVQNALEFLGCDNRIVNTPNEILNSSRLILPGVGSFDKAMMSLQSRQLIEPLNKAVLSLGMPIMGICLGMQLLASQSEEGEFVEGLSWIPGKVVKFVPSDTYKVPLMGFNDVHVTNNSNKLFAGVPDNSDFYFVHSYHFVPEDNNHIAATASHGIEFVSSVIKDNIVGVQFHPEKSQSNGLKLISNFLSLS